jgi:hypothetical protein
MLRFETCTVTYNEYNGGEKELYAGHFITNEMELESANRKLALCLCESYLTLKEEKTKKKILELYHLKENYFERRFSTNLSFDSILVQRNEIFEPTIVID